MLLTEVQFDSATAGGRGGGRGAAPMGNRPRRTPASSAELKLPAHRHRCHQGPGWVGRTWRAQATTAGYPRGYSLTVSLDGKTWSAPVAQGQGNGAATTIAFAPVNAKFVRITQTAAADNAPAWSIQRLRLVSRNH